MTLTIPKSYITSTICSCQWNTRCQVQASADVMSHRVSSLFDCRSCCQSWTVVYLVPVRFIPSPSHTLDGSKTEFRARLTAALKQSQGRSPRMRRSEESRQTNSKSPALPEILTSCIQADMNVTAYCSHLIVWRP